MFQLLQYTVEMGVMSKLILTQSRCRTLKNNRANLPTKSRQQFPLTINFRSFEVKCV